ncbi:MAG: tyrosinase family protein, partial [Blastocatellia bacterium]
MVDTARVTRYEQVKQILDHAAGSSWANYGGRGRFWHLPLHELLRIEIHGVRMIAPVEGAVHSCCEHVEQTDDAERTGRGARSGLVQGLRGQPPFDGSQYPRLPWGGAAVQDADICFISDWIDDGCPGVDHQVSFGLDGAATEPALMALHAGNVEESARGFESGFEVYGGSANEYSYKYGEIKQRTNLDCMSDTQIEKLRWAFRELYRFDKWPEDRRSYNNMALIHQNHCQHGWERFLPWHRVYLYELEQVLQDVCPDVTLPYWDWTMPQYVPDHPEKGWIIPRYFKAFLTRDSITYLVERAVPALPPEAGAELLRKVVEPGTLFTSPTTFFAEVCRVIGERYTIGEHRNRFIDALLAANSLWYPLRFPAEYYDPTTHEPVPVNKSIFHYHYPTLEDMEQILQLRTFRDFGGGGYYNDSFGFLDQNPHNTMHIWTGGQNADPGPSSAAASDDPSKNRNRGVQVKGRR